MSDDKTMRIRVAVAVARKADGTWGAWAEGCEKGAEGYGDASIKEGVEAVLDESRWVDSPVHWRWVEADVPLPVNDEPTVIGEVTK